MHVSLQMSSEFVDLVFPEFNFVDLRPKAFENLFNTTLFFLILTVLTNASAFVGSFRSHPPLLAFFAALSIRISFCNKIPDLSEWPETAGFKLDTHCVSQCSDLAETADAEVFTALLRRPRPVAGDPIKTFLPTVRAGNC
jgi:hypothetical protein